MSVWWGTSKNREISKILYYFINNMMQKHLLFPLNFLSPFWKFPVTITRRKKLFKTDISHVTSICLHLEINLYKLCERSLLPGMCDLFVWLQAVKSSSSSNNRSRMVVTSDSTSTTVGPSVSVSGGSIPFITPARNTHLSRLTAAHKASVSFNQQTNRAHPVC